MLRSSTLDLLTMSVSPSVRVEISGPQPSTPHTCSGTHVRAIAHSNAQGGARPCKVSSHQLPGVHIPGTTTGSGKPHCTGRALLQGNQAPHSTVSCTGHEAAMRLLPDAILSRQQAFRNVAKRTLHKTDCAWVAYTVMRA